MQLAGQGELLPRKVHADTQLPERTEWLEPATLSLRRVVVGLHSVLIGIFKCRRLISLVIGFKYKSFFLSYCHILRKYKSQLPFSIRFS